MKYTTIVLAGCLAVAGSALPQEKKIKRSDLPAAVEKTVAAQSKGATIRGFSEEQEKGKTTYELQMTVNGHSKDVEMDESGVLMEVEEQGPWKRFRRMYGQDCRPRPVRDESRESNQSARKTGW